MWKSVLVISVGCRPRQYGPAGPLMRRVGGRERELIKLTPCAHINELGARVLCVLTDVKPNF
jgi:hypothetical protein